VNKYYYDPSYGTDKLPANDTGKIQWEDNSIDGFGVIIINKITGEEKLWIDKLDTKGKLETIFNEL
jgi:hypothetical protein